VGVPSHYRALVSGAGSLVRAKHSLVDDGCGSVELAAGSTNLFSAELRGPQFARINSTRGFQWRMSALFLLTNIANAKFTIGLQDFNNSDLDAVFEYEVGVNGGRWQFIYRDDTAALQSVDTGLTAVASKYVWIHIAQLGSRTWFWGIADKNNQFDGVEDVGQAFAGAPTEYNFANASFIHIWNMFAKMQNSGGVAVQSAKIDMWELQDVGNPIYGPLFNVIHD
jgi:hypothetical protein